jgi:hypothetical protein
MAVTRQADLIRLLSQIEIRLRFDILFQTTGSAVPLIMQLYRLVRRRCSLSHQLISSRVQVGSHLCLVQVAGYVTELDANLGTLAVHRFPRFEEEGHAVPPRIVDVHRYRAEGWAQAAPPHTVYVSAMPAYITNNRGYSKALSNSLGALWLYLSTKRH